MQAVEPRAEHWRGKHAIQAEAPEPGQNVPALQARQDVADDCPVSPLKVPGPHARQVTGDDWPVALLNKPTPHAAHADCPKSALKVPGPQGKQPINPVALPKELNKH